jgi:hypothetical protein
VDQNRELAQPADWRPPPDEIFSRLSTALRKGGFSGWDPYDALSSPLLRSVAGTPLLRRAVIQLMKRSAVNLRPVVGVKRLRHTKGVALCVSAYVRAAMVSAGATISTSKPVGVTIDVVLPTPS